MGPISELKARVTLGMEKNAESNADALHPSRGDHKVYLSGLQNLSKAKSNQDREFMIDTGRKSEEEGSQLTYSDFEDSPH
jgi:hypothetical protein